VNKAYRAQLELLRKTFPECVVGTAPFFGHVHYLTIGERGVPCRIIVDQLRWLETAHRHGPGAWTPDYFRRHSHTGEFRGRGWQEKMVAEIRKTLPTLRAPCRWGPQ
jgi:hypothetical protein